MVFAGRILAPHRSPKDGRTFSLNDKGPLIATVAIM